MSTCQFCNKQFCNKFVLAKHQKTVKSCLAIQEQKIKQTTEIELTYANCKIEMLEKQLKEKDELLEKQLKEKDEQLKEKDEIIKEKDAFIQELASRDINPKITYNNITRIGNTTNNTNQILNLTPLQMTQEAFQERIQKTLREEHLNLPTADYVSKNLIRDEEGNLMYKITDAARNKFQYNKEGNCETDFNAAKLIEAIGKPLKEETHAKILEMIAKNNMSAEEISTHLMKEQEFTNLDAQFIRQLVEKTV